MTEKLREEIVWVCPVCGKKIRCSIEHEYGVSWFLFPEKRYKRANSIECGCGTLFFVDYRDEDALPVEYEVGKGKLGSSKIYLWRNFPGNEK